VAELNGAADLFGMRSFGFAWEPEQYRGVAECFPPFDRTSSDPNWPAPPTMRSYPHPVFSHAIRTTKASTSWGIKLPVLGTIKLRGDEPPIPGQNGVRLGSAGDISERFASHRSRRGWRPRDHSTAISIAASPSEYGSPRTDIHSAREKPLVHRSRHVR